MNPLAWPDWLDTVWAKSAEKGAGGHPETLAQHTWGVLSRLAGFMRLRPGLPVAVGLPRLWHVLYWAAFLHDFGKATSGFQAQLRPGGKRWEHRHEVLSLAFVDWIAAGFSDEEAAWMAAAIVSHHKDAAEIRRSYRPAVDADEDQLTARVAELDNNVLHGLWRWLADCATEWIADLDLAGMRVSATPLLDERQAIDAVRLKGTLRIHAWLRVYQRLVEQLTDDGDEIAAIAGLVLRGHIINADHSASAHAGALPKPDFSAQAIMASRNLRPDELFTHQKVAWDTIGSALLTAPTGSGKTEAALLWAARQAGATGSLPRLFYTLPYQASMNAMKLRLEASFGRDSVGLQHGRGLLALYRLLLQKGYTSADATREARWALNLARLNYMPVRIFSPYQMLKGMYRLKGYEALLTDYHSAAFVFDEIHAYEVQRLGLILMSIKYLARYYDARFLVMSATFPSLVKEWLREALADPAEINADATLFAKFRRHRLHLLDGELLSGENLERIAADAKAGKTVLVVCNIVARAQAAYDSLTTLLAETAIPILLLHGRFNMRARSAKELQIREQVSAGGKGRGPLVLVATQAIEVSLDIDLDTIYTEPAPLEALVQRFGRINRRGLQPDLAPVFVFRLPDTGQVIYDGVLVQRTLSLLEQNREQPINERIIGMWLDQIYSGDVAKRWQAAYATACSEFEATCVRTLRPFASDDALEDRFYQAFDSIEVLPKALFDDYVRLQEEDPILANELLVPMQFRSFMGLKGKGLVLPHDPDISSKFRFPPIVIADYTEERGLATERPAVGDDE